MNMVLSINVRLRNLYLLNLSRRNLFDFIQPPQARYIYGISDIEAWHRLNRCQVDDISIQRKFQLMRQNL